MPHWHQILVIFMIYVLVGKFCRRDLRTFPQNFGDWKGGIRRLSRFLNVWVAAFLRGVESGGWKFSVLRQNRLGRDIGGRGHSPYNLSALLSNQSYPPSCNSCRSISNRSWWRSVTKTELSFFIGRSGWQPWLPLPQYFSLLPVFAPRVTIINTPIHWDLISLSLANPEILFIKSHSCPYCIVPYDIPDWSMNIWFSPSDSFVTNFDVSLNCHKFHISAFSSIPANFTIAGTRVSSSKKVKLGMVTFSEIGIQLSGKVDFPQTFWSIIGCLRGGLY